MKSLPFLLLAVLALTSPAAQAAEEAEGRQWHMEAALGPVDEIDGKRMGAAMLSFVSDDRHPHELSIGYLQPRTGEGFNTPRVVYVSAARRFTLKRWFWVNGVVLVDGQSEALSSFYQFVNGLGWHNDHVTISVRHMSNANLRGRNRGENLLLLAWRF
jgi:hypothetical protein